MSKPAGIHKGEGCLFRWSLGLQDTVNLSDFESDKFTDMIWLAKLSILSFQHHFPEADFVLLYNGPDFASFEKMFWRVMPELDALLLIVNQRDSDDVRFRNPYHFHPRGVWWKWVPFRFDISKHEIAVDTDIVCLSRPETWYEWLNGNEEILIAPERYETVLVNTCGDFWQHPVLTGKKPFNCGVVGQRANIDFADRFFEITQEVDLGASHNSMFITEQGAINLWVRSLEVEGVKHCVLDFKKNAWVRDFLYFVERGIDIETVHAVTWHKKIVRGLKQVFERKVVNDSYTQQEFVSDLLKQSSSFEDLEHYIIRRQITPGNTLEREILLG